MKAVTIDNFDVKVHERYAEDQQKLDLQFIHEYNQVGTHPEIASLSFIYSSKWAELFETQSNNLPWAAFVTPPRYGLQPNRFFTSYILPSLPWSDDEEQGLDQEEENEEEQERKRQWEQVRALVLGQEPDEQPLSLFEQDKSTLLNLVEQIKYLNRWLNEVNARKLQYQKG